MSYCDNLCDKCGIKSFYLKSLYVSPYSGSIDLCADCYHYVVNIEHMSANVEFKDLKEGDKLYQLEYHHKGRGYPKDSRSMRMVTIKHIDSRRAKLSGIEWNVTKREFDTGKWFSSKKEAYAEALWLHEIDFGDIEEIYLRYKKEIKYLKKKVSDL